MGLCTSFVACVNILCNEVTGTNYPVFLKYLGVFDAVFKYCLSVLSLSPGTLKSE
jgi:hypothetical protein